MRIRESNSAFRSLQRLRVANIAAFLYLLAATGCEQQMASQPSYRPLVRSNFFADGRASRPLVAGTVSRDASELDLSLASGRKTIAAVASVPNAGNSMRISTQLSAGIRPDEFVAEFPFQITRDVLTRGQERYTVYCAICHDATGTGNGKIVQRGFTKPPSYLTENSRQLARSGYQMPLREVPVGYLFDVATNGYGAMADYSGQVSPRDRWAIIAYIRTLQRSQNLPLDELPPSIRNEADKSVGGDAMTRAALATSTMDWATIERRALAVGGGGIVVCAAAAILSWPHFLRAYLVAWNFWAGVSLGALALLMIQYITGGAWGLLLRRFLEASAVNILLLALLFLVLLPDVPVLYEWARPEAVAASAALQHKSAYLNPLAFMIRAAIYFVSWASIAWLLNSWSRKQDRGQRTVFLSECCQAISGPGLVVYGATVTLASIDWVMSLEPSWYSSIFPPLFAAGQILSALAFAIAALLIVTRYPPLESAVSPDQRRDMGNLLLAFVMIWAYLSFSQFMIIWSEDLPEETPWYLNRIRGGWQWIALALALLQFAVPFLLLLSREVKMNARSLAWIAVLILAMRFIDLAWWVEAAYAEPVSLYLLLDVAALLAIGGIWMWFFARRLRRSPLLPIADPFSPEYLPEAAT